ncbi:hypothetical protein MCGE09_00333 [Thaumarchaeota archaeon SCGC AB-539-E09]|nr:hypothetical protein MCGE09_00333 [Thaumarchaeota archaeon SCGC AB-539-E09]
MLGISVALYIYLHQRYWSEVNLIRKRIDSNLSRIEKAFKKLNPKFVFNFPYGEDNQIKGARPLTTSVDHTIRFTVFILLKLCPLTK